MSKNKKQFANLLKGATLRIQSENVIQTGSAKTKKEVYEALGDAVGVSADTIEWWSGSTRKTFPDDDALENLVRSILMQVDMGPEWVKELATCAGYIGTTGLLRELYPSTAEEKPERALPPRHLNFIGRVEETAYFSEHLKQESIAVITGMTGVGKSALAAHLAQEWGKSKQVFWHQCYEYDGIEIIERLASFLAYHGQRDVWGLIHKSEQNNTPLPDNKKLFYKLAREIRKSANLLCFDDFHKIENEPDIQYFVRQLLDGLSANNYALIFVGQREFNLFRRYNFKQLQGLKMSDAHELFNDLNLPEHLEKELYRRTDGNAELLTLVRGWLSPKNQLENLLQDLTHTEEISGFVLERIHRNLTSLQKQVMQGISIFMGYASTRNAIEYVLEDQNVFEELLYLKQCYFLNEDTGARGRVYSSHNIVRTFYYDSLSEHEQIRMHRRAAAYYHEREQNIVLAAFHLEKASAYADLIQLIANNIWALINQGHGEKIPLLFERVAAKSNLDFNNPSILFWWAKVKGSVYQIQGKYQEAVQVFEDALKNELSTEYEADLMKQLGATYERSGEFEEALARHLQQLDLWQKMGRINEHMTACYAVGWSYLNLGKTDEAETYIKMCLDLAEEHKDEHHIGLACLAQGILDYKHERLPEAKENFTKSRDIFHQRGDLLRESQLINNLALIYHQMDDTARAIENTKYATEVAEKIGDISSQLIGYGNLGYFYTRLNDHVSAIQHYEKLIDLAAETNHMRMLSIGHSGLAEAELIGDNINRALELAQQAHQIAQTHNDKAALGESYRVLGNIWLALKDANKAKAYFEKSIPLLKEMGRTEELQQAQQGYQQAISDASGQNPPA